MEQGGRGERRKRGEEEELISMLTNGMGSRAPHNKHSHIPGGRIWRRALPTLPQDTWNVLVEVPHTGWCLGSKILCSVSLLHHPSCFPDFLPSLVRVPFFQNQRHEFFLSDHSVFYSKHRKPFAGIVFSNTKPESINQTINVFKKIGSDFSIFLFISYFYKLLECAWLRPALLWRLSPFSYACRKMTGVLSWLHIPSLAVSIH